MNAVQLIRTEKELPASALTLRELFWDIERWQKIWDPVHKVSVVYDDRQHQEFMMELEWRGERATIRTIRFLTGNGDIEFFSPNPPGEMTDHCGSWQFLDTGEKKCRVVAQRQFRLRRSPDELDSDYSQREAEFATSFCSRLGRILDAFDEYLSVPH